MQPRGGTAEEGTRGTLLVDEFPYLLPQFGGPVRKFSHGKIKNELVHRHRPQNVGARCCLAAAIPAAKSSVIAVSGWATDSQANDASTV